MKKFIKVLISIVCIYLLFLLIVAIVPAKKVMDNNPFITDKIMIAAHRGGADLNPDNTMKAFDAAVIDYAADILELDVHMTKDNQLVVIHDSDINDFCDVEVVKNTTESQYVIDYTYEELLMFNFGYQFKTLDGLTPYKDLCQGLDETQRKETIKNNGLSIVKLDDLINHFMNDYPDLMYIVEIKNGGEIGYKAADQINTMLTETYANINLVNKMVIGTFHGEIEEYLSKTYPHILRGASTKAAASFIITEIFNVNVFDNGSFACLQIPQSYDLGFIELSLNRKDIIRRCHERNIAVQYWTLNTREEMEIAIELGCDCIMTDNPKLLYEILKEHNLR